MRCIDCFKYEKEIVSIKMDLETLIEELLDIDTNNIKANSILSKYFDLSMNRKKDIDKFYIDKLPVRKVVSIR